MLDEKVTITTDDLKRGDQIAFRHLFTNFYENLCSYGYTIVRDMDEAEDIVQKIYCKLWDQRVDLNIHTSIKSYLYRAVHNDCLNRLKQQKRHSKHNTSYSYSLPSTSNPQDGTLTYSELKQQVVKTLDTLPPQCKKVFELSRVEQLSYVEIGKRLNLSVNTVENHMSKALKLMRQGLKDFLPILLLLISKIDRI